MKRSAKLPTLLGMFVLAIGLIAGIFLVNSRQIFRIGAEASITPKNVRVTNITNSSLTVTWTTDLATKGFVKWGSSEGSLGKVTQEEGENEGLVHSATLTAIEDGSTIFFAINSNGQDFKNDGIPWSSSTYPQAATSATPLTGSGTITDTDGNSPAKAIIYLTINGVTMSSLTSDEGSWVIPISNYVSSIPDNAAIEIAVLGKDSLSSQAVIYPTYVKSTPTIVLGKTYDFRSLTLKDIEVNPESKIDVPQTNSEQSSRFEVTTNGNNQPTSGLTIDSVDDGEIINTNDPEFFGKAPSKSAIEITVESELQSATVVSANDGTWKWSPPNNLEPGEHKVTVKLRDSSGILRTITRTFVVQASEGPAFESTPSATPRQTTTPTPTTESQVSPTPAVTERPVEVATSTPRPTPETGNLTPTLGLFIMGIGILLSSVYIWRKEYAEQ